MICPVCQEGWGDEETGPLSTVGLCPLCRQEHQIATARQAADPIKTPPDLHLDG